MCERNRIRSALTIRIQTVASSTLDSCVSNRTSAIHFSHFTLSVVLQTSSYQVLPARQAQEGKGDRGKGNKGKGKGVPAML